MAKARTPQVVADAAIEIVSRPSQECSGHTFLDVDVLRSVGVTDLSPYGGTAELDDDILVDPPGPQE